jgi:hypothetical protein
VSGPKVTLMVAGVETEVFVRLHCGGCDGRVMKEFALAGQILGNAQQITVAVTEPIDAAAAGWFVHDGTWYCPLHEIRVVARPTEERPAAPADDPAASQFYRFDQAKAPHARSFQ